MQHDGSGLEENKAGVLKDRDLTERLESAVLRFVLISLLEQARVVRQTGFLQSPAHAQITYLAFGNVRNPFERGYRDHFVCSSIELCAMSKWRMSWYLELCNASWRLPMTRGRLKIRHLNATKSELSCRWSSAGRQRI